jgi:hypothetical protein
VTDALLLVAPRKLTLIKTSPLPSIPSGNLIVTCESQLKFGT